MAETYASKAEFDTLRQQIQSDPSAAFAAFRCMPQVVQRNHVAGGTPAAIAARIATHRVQQLRELTTAEVDRVGAAADVSSSTVLAHIEQMRGGR